MLIVDANFAVDVVLGSFLRDPFYEELQKGAEVVVPRIYYNEVTNALWQYVRADILTPEGAASKLEEAFSFVGKVGDDEEIAIEVLTESIKRNHPVYDMFYLVLARRNNATLCTLDKKLQTLCIKEGIGLVCPVD